MESSGSSSVSARRSIDRAVRRHRHAHQRSPPVLLRPSSFSSSGATTSTTESTTDENLRNDGNTVDLETEMTALTETQIKYSAVAALLTDKFNQLYDVLGGH